VRDKACSILTTYFPSAARAPETVAALAAMENDDDADDDVINDY
jgi:hypothetical protein